jgi:hypothetical protein
MGDIIPERWATSNRNGGRRNLDGVTVGREARREETPSFIAKSMRC